MKLSESLDLDFCLIDLLNKEKELLEELKTLVEVDEPEKDFEKEIANDEIIDKKMWELRDVRAKIRIYFELLKDEM